MSEQKVLRRRVQLKPNLTLADVQQLAAEPGMRILQTSSPLTEKPGS